MSAFDVADPGIPIGRSGSDLLVTAIAGGAIVFLAAATYAAVNLRQATLVLIGAALGFVLYHATFGFTGAWRAFILERRSAGLRAQTLMIAIASVLMLPFIARGTLLGLPVGGAFGPIGPSLAVGALLFGFGMQLGGGCGSGTLYTVGGGSVRMLVTLLFFVVGAVFGAAHLPWWSALPNIGVVRLPTLVGTPATLALTLVALAVVWRVVSHAERSRYGDMQPLVEADDRPTPHRLSKGPWPLLWGAVALAVLNLATLAVAGHPWSITFAFNLWGAKALAALGVDVASWEYWTWPMPAQALASPVLAETTSVMDFGLVLGALLATGLAARFAPDWRIPPRQLAAAVIGGLLMGYGARLSFGCNIGALFGGIVSGSLHGWAWFALAFLGSIAGVRARPLFGFVA